MYYPRVNTEFIRLNKEYSGVGDSHFNVKLLQSCTVSYSFDVTLTLKTLMKRYITLAQKKFKKEIQTQIISYMYLEVSLFSCMLHILEIDMVFLIFKEIIDFLNFILLVWTLTWQ